MLRSLTLGVHIAIMLILVLGAIRAVLPEKVLPDDPNLEWAEFDAAYYWFVGAAVAGYAALVGLATWYAAHFDRPTVLIAVDLALATIVVVTLTRSQAPADFSLIDFALYRVLVALAIAGAALAAMVLRPVRTST